MPNSKLSKAERDKIPAEDFAGPGRSFPITDQAHLDAAVRLLGKADDPAAVKLSIIAIAKRKGLDLPESWEKEGEPDPDEATDPKDKAMRKSLALAADTLVNYGGAIKAAGNGRLVGPGVTFGGKDMDGEYFHADTYYGAHGGDGVDTFFHHCLPIKGFTDEMNEELSSHVFPAAKAKRTEEGIFFEVVLNMADKWEKRVYQAAKAGKLGFSTGAPAHTVKKSEDGAIDRWLISELSLTPTRAEPRNAVVALKSVQDEDVDYAALFDDIETKTADEEDEPEVLAVLRAMPMKAYLETMGSVVSDFDRRLTWYVEDRAVKSGRTISAENLAAMRDVHDGMRSHLDNLKKIIDRHSDQKPQKMTAQGAYMDYLYAQAHGGTISLGATNQ